MKIERTKNASRNIIFGFIQRIYQILAPFLMRTAMLYFMGVEYLGLNSLFASILQVLNLAELGVGAAMVYSMYKPIAEDNTKRINALMQMYKVYYRIIGIVIGIAGLSILPFIPSLVKSELPSELNIYILYLLNLGTTVLTYWLFAYKNCLLNAHQRTDILSKIALITTSTQYCLQIIVIVYIKNYYLYCIVALVTQIINNLITSCIVSKMYPDYKAGGKLDKEETRDINYRIRDLFTAKIGYVIVNSADTVVISAFLGITVLAIYQNYYFILTAIIGIVGVIFNSCTAGIGNSIILESKDKNFDDLRKFTFLIAWIATFCGTCFLCLFQPFMLIWVGEELMLTMPAVICFCIYYYVYEINSLLNLYKDAAGIWHKDRYRPLMTALTNLILNIITVQYWGIYGVLLSTVISTLFVGMPWLIHNLFTTLFEKKYLKSYVWQLINYFFIAIAIATLTYFVCIRFNYGKVLTLIVRLVICIALPNIICCLLFRKKTEFKDVLLLIETMTKGKIRLINIFSIEI